MDQLNEYSKEVVDRFLKSMGYDPNHIDRDKRMAFTKTIRFQQFAQRMGEEFEIEEQMDSSPTMTNKPYTKGLAQSRTHTKDMALKRSVHVNKPQLPVKTEALEFPQGDFDAKGTSAKVVGEKKISKSANLVKSIYKKHRLKEELYDHEKDDKDGTTYGKKPKYSSNKQEAEQQGGQSDKKTQAAAVLSGGTTLTGQKRDTVEIDPLLKKSKPGSPNGEVGASK
jgi:hypothetical protein